MFITLYSQHGGPPLSVLDLKMNILVICKLLA